MIGRLRGRLSARYDHRIVVDVGGVGYEVLLPAAVGKALAAKSVGEEVELVTMYFLQVDQARATPLLIGFQDELEREFFERLLSVPKLGPRGALHLFSMPMSLVASAIEEGSEKMLVTLPGVGKQRARDIIASLQGKMAKFALKQEDVTIAAASVEPVVNQQSVYKEALDIMLALGYKRREAEEMLKKAQEKLPAPESAEELVRAVYEQQKGERVKG